MANKKKKYNAKFPPARVKKIMQKDEEVGKVAAAVPVIIARALEFFVMDLMSKANERILSKNAKTLTPEHIKQTVNMVEEFSFLKELVAPIAEVQSNNNEFNTNKHTAKQKHESKQSKQDPSTLNSEDPSAFKVPTRGRPKKVKTSFDEGPLKSKKQKLNNKPPYQEDQHGMSNGEEIQQTFSMVLPNANIEASNITKNAVFSSPSHQSSFSPPSSFTHILFQPNIEPIFVNTSQLTTSNKIGDALQAINNNTANNFAIDSTVFSNSFLKYNNFISDGTNATPNIINLPQNTENTNATEGTPSLPQVASDLSQASKKFPQFDEVLDLSKQSSNQQNMDNMIHNYNTSNHTTESNPNIFFTDNINSTLFPNVSGGFLNANNNILKRSAMENKAHDNNNNNENRQSDLYKLNVPNLNTIYHRTNSS